MIRRLLDKLLYVEDAPFSDMGRRWRWAPSVELDREHRALHVGISLDLVQWEGKPCSPQAVRYFDVSMRPFDWQIGQEHTYYDGPHCCYKLGPVWITKSWVWCNRCAEESGA